MNSEPSELRRVVDAIWDLRDAAFDHPEDWGDLRAEEVFQALAKVMEDLEESDQRVEGGPEFVRMVQTALGRSA